jgi:hypothetical protein
MRILIWHVHGGWMDAFVQGGHDYLLPVDPGRGPWGLGRGGRDWPAGATEVRSSRLKDQDIDVVVLQRPEELELAEHLLGRRPGRDVPAVYVEHNTPHPAAAVSVHPMTAHPGVVVVHVTRFNRLMWDTAGCPTLVIEHGIPDPGYRYTGELERQGALVNDPVRRWRVTGTDLLPAFAQHAPVDLFGMGTDLAAAALGVDEDRIVARGDVPSGVAHEALAHDRLALHLHRWTSLGLSLLEAMHLGMPVVVLATTEAPRAVPPEAGALSIDPDELVRAAERLLRDPDDAAARGRIAREAALERYGLGRFLSDWDALLDDVTTRRGRPVALGDRRRGRSIR